MAKQVEPVNKVQQAEVRQVMRSQITLAAYNPRKITPEARKLLKDNLKRVGLLGGIVWNEDTGNLVSGHQRVSVMDEINRYRRTLRRENREGAEPLRQQPQRAGRV